MNDKRGKYYAVVKRLFPTFRQCFFRGFCPPEEALPKRREMSFDYSVVFTYFGGNDGPLQTEISYGSGTLWKLKLRQCLIFLCTLYW